MTKLFVSKSFKAMARRAMMQLGADYLDRIKAGAEVIPLVRKK